MCSPLGLETFHSLFFPLSTHTPIEESILKYIEYYGPEAGKRERRTSDKYIPISDILPPLIKRI